MVTGRYATNPGGMKGKAATIQMDSSFADWSEDMLIAQGVANDDPRIFRGAHEGPVYDLYSLYAAWDDDNLYLGWQYTNANDITSQDSSFPISDNGKPYAGDIGQTVLFDVDPSKETDGIMQGGNNTVWNNKVIDTYANGVDHLAKFSSKYPMFAVGEPALFKLNSNNKFEYDTAAAPNVYVKGFELNGIEMSAADGFFPSTMTTAMVKGWYDGVGGHAGDTPDALETCDYEDLLTYTDANGNKHSTSQDTFYEMKIPLTVLGIDRSYIENTGIGVMVVATFGESAIGSLPHDPTVLDNAAEAYGPDESTSHEKDDTDNFTSPMARIGK